MSSPIRILVTGANGFIGKSFLNSLDWRNQQVSALDITRDPAIADLSLQNYYAQDITEPLQIDGEFDFVFHLAALNLTHVGKAEYEQYQKVNVLGTQNLLKAVRTQNFVFISTAKVYATDSQAVNEGSPLAPKGNYERSKLEAEKVCQNEYSGKNLFILRPVNITGPGQEEKALLPVFFKNAANNLPVDIFAPRGTRVQLLDIADVIAAFKLIIERGGINGTYNLAPEESISIEDLASAIVSINGSASAVSHSNNDQAHFCKVLADKISRDIGWQPRYSPQDIIQHYYESLKIAQS